MVLVKKENTGNNMVKVRQGQSKGRIITYSEGVVCKKCPIYQTLLKNT